MAGETCVQSIIVDSTPTMHGPPSRIKSFGDRKSDKSSLTAIAVVGETLPNLFALGAATPKPPSDSNSLRILIAIGCAGTLMPTLS